MSVYEISQLKNELKKINDFIEFLEDLYCLYFWQYPVDVSNIRNETQKNLLFIKYRIEMQIKELKKGEEI